MPAVMKHVGWNAAMTLGVALTSGTVTLIVSKAGHASFEIPQDIKKTSSAVIRLFAFLTGAAVGFCALQKASVVTMDLDQTFISAHALAVVSTVYCAVLACIVSFDEDKRTTVLYASVGALALSTPFVARFGQNALIPALGIGAAGGSYF
jgi:hypothetical protein